MITKCSVVTLLGLAFAGSFGWSTAALAKGGVDFASSVAIVSFDSSSSGRMELNLGMHASLAIEASYIHEHERVREETTQETGESLLVETGRSFSVHLGRYSDSARLAGFYWSLGVGYQTMEMRWAVPADDADPDVDFGLANEAGLLSHRASLAGVTGYGRLGYRYVADDFPFMAGIHVGLTHYQAGVDDFHSANGEEAEAGIADLTNSEKDRLQRRFKTSFTPGVSIGVAF